MKTMRLFVTLMMGSASAAFAAAESQGEGMGILIYMFVGFFALIIVAQLVPAIILFSSMIKGLFRAPKKSSVKTDA
jgi:hypothetical protein